MQDAKALYAALGVIIASLFVANIPLEGLDDLEPHIAMLVEMGVSIVVQAAGAYWGAWWAVDPRVENAG